MNFEQRLQVITAPLGPVRRVASYPRDQPAGLVAAYAPHVLGRFAALAASLQTLQQAEGQGVILACRNGHLGYRTTEYRSRNLHIVLDASDREAYLRWEANGEVGTHLLTAETTKADLDAALLDVVSAFVRSFTDIEAAC